MSTFFGSIPSKKLMAQGMEHAFGSTSRQGLGTKRQLWSGAARLYLTLFDPDSDRTVSTGMKAPTIRSCYMAGFTT